MLSGNYSVRAFHFSVTFPHQSWRFSALFSAIRRFSVLSRFRIAPFSRFRRLFRPKTDRLGNVEGTQTVHVQCLTLTMKLSASAPGHVAFVGLRSRAPI